jgi:hypothetical protein
MANIEVTINTSQGSATYTSPELSDAQFDRAVNYFWRNWTPFDEEGNDLPRTPLAEAQAFKNWAASVVWRGLRKSVVAEEKLIASIAAKNSVGDLE